MQLGILIENMRREGYELSVAPPQVRVRVMARIPVRLGMIC